MLAVLEPPGQRKNAGVGDVVRQKTGHNDTATWWVEIGKERAVSALRDGTRVWHDSKIRPQRRTSHPCNKRRMGHPLLYQGKKSDFGIWSVRPNQVRPNQ